MDLQSIVDKFKKNIQQGLASKGKPEKKSTPARTRKPLEVIGAVVPSAFEEARDYFDAVQGKAQQVVNDKTKGIRETIGEFTYSPQTIPQDWKFRMRNMSNRFQASPENLIQIPHGGFGGPRPIAESLGKEYEGATPMRQFEINEFWKSTEDSTPTAEASARHVPYNFKAPKEDAIGKELKEVLLKNPALLPGVRKYFESLPMSAVEDGYEHGFAGVFYGDNDFGEEYIQVDKRNNGQASPQPGQMAQDVAAHELLHGAVDVLGLEGLNNFVADFNQVYQANPQKYEPVMKWIKEYKGDSTRDNYFKNPLREANELFAQVGAIYGPTLANDPLLGKYYQRVFDRNSEAAQPIPDITMRFEDGSSDVMGARRGWNPTPRNWSGTWVKGKTVPSQE